MDYKFKKYEPGLRAISKQREEEAEKKLECDKYRRYANDPLRFLMFVLKFKPRDWQVDVVNSIGDGIGISRLLVISSQGCGKSYLASAVIAWALICRYKPIIQVMAVTANQSHNTLISTVSSLLEDAGLKHLVKRDAHAGAELVCPSNGGRLIQSCINLSDHRIENNKGLHPYNHKDGLYMLVTDEMATYPDIIFEKLEGNLQAPENEYNNCIQLLLGNSSRDRNCFMNRIRQNPHWGYKTHVVKATGMGGWSKEQEEFFQHADEKFPGYISLYRDCDIPEEDRVLVDWETLEARCIDNEYQWKDQIIVMGVDISTGTDACKSAFCIRQGHRILHWESRVVLELDMAAEVERLCREFNVERVYFDSAGYTAELDRAVSQFVSSEKVHGSVKLKEGFINYRAKCIWGMKKWLEDDRTVIFLNHEEKRILSSIKYWEDDNRRIQIQNKRDILKELRVNRWTGVMDKIDALSYTFAHTNNPVLDRNKAFFNTSVGSSIMRNSYIGGRRGGRRIR